MTDSIKNTVPQKSNRIIKILFAVLLIVPGIYFYGLLDIIYGTRITENSPIFFCEKE